MLARLAELGLRSEFAVTAPGQWLPWNFLPEGDHAVPTSMIFASTVLVVWAVAYIPHALRTRTFGALALSAVVLFGIYIHLSWEVRPFPWNILGALGVFAIAFGGGLVQHHYNGKHREE